MSDNFRKTNANNQSTNNDENKNDEVMTFNYQPGPSSDMTENKIVVFDYTTIGMQINQNLNSFGNLNVETIDLHKFNISYEDIVETFKEKLMTKIVDGKYVMSDKDAINLDKIIGLACIAMSESEKNNKQLRTKNRILQNKYGNYDYLVKECNRLKSEMDQIKINLCLALSRRFNDKEDVIHLTNICAALAARENEYYSIQVKNDKLKYVINKQLMNIRLSTLNSYDEILQSVEKLKEGLYIKDLKISQLEDEILYSINEEKYIQLQLLHENVFQFPDQNCHGAFDYTQNNNELYEGKMLIAEQINQIQGSSDVEFEDHKLCDLINMLAKLTTDKKENLKTINICLIKNIEDKNQQLIKEINDYKKWQIYLENENEKLNSQIKNKIMVQTILIGKQNEHNNLKQDYLKLQLMYDKLKERDLLTLLDECRQRLSDVEIKCVDGDRLIKTLQSNIIEQTNKYKLVNAKYNKEKEKCQKNKIYTQQIMDEFTDRLHEKQIEIALVQNENNDLKHRIKSDKDYTWNLKCYIITLDNVLKEKNKIIHKLKTQSKLQQQQQQHTATSGSSSLLSGNHLHINSKLKEQMDILLNNIGTWKNIIVGYEKVLYNMQNAAQQQSKKSNYWINKYQHLKDIEYKATLTENLTKEKEFILLQHQNEIEDIREKYNPIIAHMADTQANLRNEIRDLKESLKLKNAHLMVTEKIANSQLNESLTTLQRLTKVCNIQEESYTVRSVGQYSSLILNDINNEIPERCCDTSITNTRNNISQLMEGLVDYTSKLQSENTFMKRLCEIREEKIRSLENCLCLCRGTSLHQ